MKSQKKPRVDAKLKTLPEDRQWAIADYARDHSMEDTINWLRQDGISTSLAALSEFLSWHSLRQQMAHNASTVETLLAEFIKNNPKTSPDAIQQMGQSFFTAMALQSQDPKAWYLTQQVGIKQQQLQLEREKFQVLACEYFLQWFKDKQAQEIANSTSSNADKIARLRQTYFADVDALQASGKVVLPS